MAITFVASSHAFVDGTTLTCDKPSGVTAGDVMVATVFYWVARTITPPSGWTLLLSQADEPDSDIAKVYYKVAGGSEPSTYSWSFDSSSIYTVTIGAYRGVDTSAPINASSIVYNGNVTTFNATSITTTVDNAMLLFIGASSAFNGFMDVDDPPTGFTEREDWYNAWRFLYLADSLQTSAGASGNKTAVAGSGNNRLIAALVALAPAGSARPPAALLVAPPPAPQSAPPESLPARESTLMRAPKRYTTRRVVQFIQSDAPARARMPPAETLMMGQRPRPALIDSPHAFIVADAPPVTARRVVDTLMLSGVRGQAGASPQRVAGGFIDVDAPPARTAPVESLLASLPRAFVAPTVRVAGATLVTDGATQRAPATETILLTLPRSAAVALQQRIGAPLVVDAPAIARLAGDAILLTLPRGMVGRVSPLMVTEAARSDLPRGETILFAVPHSAPALAYRVSPLMVTEGALQPVARGDAILLTLPRSVIGRVSPLMVIDGAAMSVPFATGETMLIAIPRWLHIDAEFWMRYEQALMMRGEMQPTMASEQQLRMR